MNSSTKNENKIVKFWDKTALIYDKEEQKDREIYQQIITNVKSHLKKSDVVLDFGCGTGTFSNTIAKFTKKVHAIDLSSNMIEIAEKKAKEQNITNIEYNQATIFDDHLKASSYDAIFGFYILHLLDNQKKVLLKINNLLKPNGLFISVTPCMGGKNVFSSVLSLISKLGIIPPFKFYQLHVLEFLLLDSQFDVLEKNKLEKTSNQYYIVAKKRTLL